jgi:hypothetical protein
MGLIAEKRNREVRVVERIEGEGLAFFFDLEPN